MRLSSAAETYSLPDTIRRERPHLRLRVVLARGWTMYSDLGWRVQVQHPGHRRWTTVNVVTWPRYKATHR